MITIRSANMRSVFVYNNRETDEGILCTIGDSIDRFIKELSLRFKYPQGSIRLFSSNGSEIKDLQGVCEYDRIYIGTEDDLKAREAVLNAIKEIHVSPETDKPSGKMPICNNVTDWITLNIGGKHFTTSKGTLLAKEPQSMLARMFADDNAYLMNPSTKDSAGAFLIDRSPEYFGPILNYLRHGDVILDKHINPKGVLEEAKFFGVESMIPQLMDIIERAEILESENKPLTRNDVIKSLIITPTTSELRYQGVNLSGADLSRLDLHNINFKYACLSKCNLSGANLSFCCLERADLSQANLEGAQLLGVRAMCANMEGANLKGCNMEDPAGSRAIMEGVNLKGANLEESNMAAVNLRVATLKNANLQNCDLRAAVLAGADLECCDLSGSDLQEANLRGANLKDAAFELMLTPLHMSQTIR